MRRLPAFSFTEPCEIDSRAKKEEKKEINDRQESLGYSFPISKTFTPCFFCVPNILGAKMKRGEKQERNGRTLLIRWLHLKNGVFFIGKTENLVLFSFSQVVIFEAYG